MASKCTRQGETDVEADSDISTLPDILSVASQLVPAGRLSVTNLSLENNLPMFQLNAPVIIRAKVKKCLMCDDHWSIQLKHWQAIF